MNRKLSRTMAWTRLTLVLAVLSALCLAAVAQENTAEDWYKKGYELEVNRAYEEALMAYDKAIEINPQYTKAWSGKGYALSMMAALNHDQSKYNESLKAYDRAIELNQSYVEAWRGKAAVFYNMKRYDEALQYIDKAIEINPRYSWSWLSKGSILSKMGRFEEAIEAYDNALKLDPNQPGAHEARGLALAELDRQSEAAESYNKALEPYDKAIETANSTQDLAQAWIRKGFVLQEQGKYEEAVNALDNATNADPKNEMAWKIKGVLLWRELKRYDEAIKSFDKALQINPKDPLIWLNKGNALKALGRQTEADAAFAKAKELGYKG